MMYPLGTRLIFDNLTQASAAADLFGKEALETSGYQFSGTEMRRCWYKGFALSPKWGDVHYIGQAGEWRMVIDTPEKQGWFMPQLGDTVLAWCYPAARPQPPGMEVVHILGEHDTDWCTFSVTPDGSQVKRIIERGGKPFPQPCTISYE
jgi:hypothetical protein